MDRASGVVGAVTAAETKKKDSRWNEFMRGLERSSLLLCAGVCLLAISIVIWGVPTHIGSHSYPLWMLFFIAGVVAIAGGTLASLAPDEDEDKMPESTENYVVVERKKWDSTMKELTDLRTLSTNVLPQAEAKKGEAPAPEESLEPAKPQAVEPEAPIPEPAQTNEAPTGSRRRSRRRRRAREEAVSSGDPVNEEASEPSSK